MATCKLEKDQWKDFFDRVSKTGGLDRKRAEIEVIGLNLRVSVSEHFNAQRIHFETRWNRAYPGDVDHPRRSMLTAPTPICWH